MSEPMTPSPDGASAAALRARLDQLHRDLEAQARRTNRSATLTAVVAALALTLLGAYFVYGYIQFEEVTRPERLVDVAQVMIEENLPATRKAVEDEVTKSAPAWAEGLSKQTAAALPIARERLRDYAMERIGASVDEATLISEEQFRTFLRQNRAALDKQFDELAKDPKRAEASVAELEAMLEVQLKADMKAQSADVLSALTQCNAKLKRLGTAQSADLTREERIELQVLKLARALQEQSKSKSATAAAGSVRPTAGGGQ